MSVGRMPEYTLNELEEFGFTEVQQAMMFGNTIKEMRKINPNGTLSTWIKLEDQFSKKEKC